MQRTAILIASLAVGLAAPAFGGETVTEHETYEKRSMKIETMQAPVTTTTRPGRVTENTYEEVETRRVERPAPIVEKRTIVEEPAPAVREKTVERTETED